MQILSLVQPFEIDNPQLENAIDEICYDYNCSDLTIEFHFRQLIIHTFDLIKSRTKSREWDRSNSVQTNTSNSSSNERFDLTLDQCWLMEHSYH